MPRDPSAISVWGLSRVSPILDAPLQLSHPLLERSIKLRMFAMLRYIVNSDRLAAHLEEHLRWMIERETDGVVFLSGPVISKSGENKLDGLTILATRSMSDAVRLAHEDPLVRSGAVTFELCEWMIYEGSVNMRISLSDSSVEFGG